MSGNGLTFTGDWEYDQGGCGCSCGWNGECRRAPASRTTTSPLRAQPPPVRVPAVLERRSTDCERGRVVDSRRVSADGDSRILLRAEMQVEACFGG